MKINILIRILIDWILNLINEMKKLMSYYIQHLILLNTINLCYHVLQKSQVFVNILNHSYISNQPLQPPPSLSISSMSDDISRMINLLMYA